MDVEDDRKEGWLMTAKEARRMTAMGRGGGGGEGDHKEGRR